MKVYCRINGKLAVFEARTDDPFEAVFTVAEHLKKTGIVVKPILAVIEKQIELEAA